MLHTARGFSRAAPSRSDGRFRFLAVAFILAGAVIILKLGYLQIAQYGLYSLYASDQHELAKKLQPTRGQILVRDKTDGTLHPLATNRVVWQIYAVPKDMKDPATAAHALAAAFALDDAELTARLTKRKDDPYELLQKDADADTVARVKALNLEGIGIIETTARLYPEKGIGGQLVGFVAENAQSGARGQYGIEGAFDKILAGTAGSVVAEADASGRRLTFGNTNLTEAVNGSDVVLTIDRTIQYKACDIIGKAVAKHGADGGSLIILDPRTGAVLAMCSSPDFESADFQTVKNLQTLNNQVTIGTYEPGSVFKPFTLAAGLDAGKITPKTTFEDTGVVEIDNFKIRDSDKIAHGTQTMTEVLEKSLNLGTIFVEQQIGLETFRSYMERFGFGKKTGIELSPEAKGNMSSLAKKGRVFGATASYGQGITMTPMQLVAAFASLGNGGKLMRPYIVDEIVHPDGTRERTKPQIVDQPISLRTSRLISGMLVSVVENGHGKRAGVPGYWVAGKTGTAQVPKKSGPGYEANATIGSFAGYAPASDPKFVMLVKIDHPRDVEWAESSAAPLFGEMAKFLLTYLEVPPERPIGAPVIAAPVASTSTAPTTTKR